MTILFEKFKNGVAKITLNRPEVHNAFNEHMIAELKDAFADLQNCPKTHVVVLSANGKSFSAGADLDWMKRAAAYSFEENLADGQKLSDMLNDLYNLKQLTIASVHGAVMGGGLGLISCADIIIGDRASKFALSEVNLGLIPATISPFVLAAIGARQAKRYFQTGEFFNAETAHSIGLIHEIATNDDQREETVNRIIEHALKSAPKAMKQAKRLALDFAEMPINDDLRHETVKRIATIRTSDEAATGLTAFFEKRKADWGQDV